MTQHTWQDTAAERIINLRATRRARSLASNAASEIRESLDNDRRAAAARLADTRRDPRQTEDRIKRDEKSLAAAEQALIDHARATAESLPPRIDSRLSNAIDEAALKLGIDLDRIDRAT